MFLWKRWEKKLDSTRIITYIRDGVLADALYEDGRMMELSLISKEKESILGNIYIGKVKNIVKNIQAAFVEIEPGLLCYLPLEDVKHPVYLHPKAKQTLVQGDELLVQVSREAVKTKAPSVTTKFSLTGKYLVLTHGNETIGFSGKLDSAEKSRLKTWTAGLKLPDEVGIIVRTNASGVSEEELSREYEHLEEQYAYLRQQAIHRSVYSCVLRNRPAYLSSVLGSRSENLKEILTDDTEIYKETEQFLRDEMPGDEAKLRLYEDRMLPLKALYRMEKDMTEALAERVWLKSGGYLVIEATEALTVIDVNTGKCIAGKEKQATIRKINQEAAQEIARQLRLRNLSGIILVDFVDMTEPGADEELLAMMQKLLKRDPLKAAAVDMTALGLMELTRKKQKKTLKEQAKECGIL